jgi:hypothetical protein
MSAKFVTTKDLAARYSVHHRTIAKWVRCRILPVVKINRRCVRFDVQKCDEILDKRTRLSGLVFTPFLLLCTVILLPFYLAFAATEWQQIPHEREGTAFVNRWSSVQTRQPAPRFSRLKASASRLITRFSLARASERLEALWCF